MDSLQGSLLLAGGHLFDPNFRRSVILVTHHGEEGALGLVLNRPATVAVEDAAPALASLVEPGARLFLGGPVQREMTMALAEFDHEGLAGKIVVGSIGFLPTDVAAGILRGVRQVRIFAGYAGWGPGQLEAELAESSWITEPAGADDVFTERPEELWSSILKRKGGRYRTLALMPFDPSTN
ncbi:MAG: YqgE/AlgH family protein [Actinomycetota bacterium]